MTITTRPRFCFHPLSCMTCDRLGYSCGAHRVGEPEHVHCTGEPNDPDVPWNGTATYEQLQEIFAKAGVESEVLDMAVPALRTSLKVNGSAVYLVDPDGINELSCGNDREWAVQVFNEEELWPEDSWSLPASYTADMIVRLTLTGWVLRVSKSLVGA